MSNLVLIQVDELRQIIRDELAASTPESTLPTSASKPITQRELCNFLGLSEPTVIRWRKKGKIPFMQIGSALRYDKEAVIKAISEKKKGRLQK